MTETQAEEPARAGIAPSSAVLQGSARAPLPDQGFLSVAGTDAAAFLHAQFSSDILSLEPGQSTLTSYSDARGRVLAVPRVLAEDDRFLLALPRDRIEAICSLLAKYVLRSDVALSDISDEWACFGATGQSAAVALAAAAGDLSGQADRAIRAPGGASVVTLSGPRPCWLAHGPEAAIHALWEALEPHTRAANPQDWRLLQIEAGIPVIHDATAGHFVAQMLNLDQLGAIDFRKGCYPGQEVIARTHYLGRIKRRMYILRVQMDECPQPGAAVFANGQEIGECVDAAFHSAGGVLALAVLRVESAGSELAVGSADGPVAVAEVPPYAPREQSE